MDCHRPCSKSLNEKNKEIGLRSIAIHLPSTNIPCPKKAQNELSNEITITNLGHVMRNDHFDSTDSN